MPGTTQKFEKTEARRPHPPSASVEKSGKDCRHGNDGTLEDNRDSLATPPPAYVGDNHHEVGERNVHKGRPDHKRHHNASLPEPLPEWSGRGDSKQKCHHGRHHGHHHRFRRHHNSEKPGEQTRGRHSKHGRRGGWRRDSSTSSSSSNSSSSSGSSHEKARQLKESLKQMVRRFRGKI